MGYEDRHFCPMALILCSYIWLFHTCKKKIPDFQKLLILKCCNQETISHQRQRNETEGRRHPGAVWYTTHKTPRFKQAHLSKQRVWHVLYFGKKKFDNLIKKNIIFDTHDVNTLVYGRIIKCVSRNKAVFILSFSFLSYLGLTNG